MKFYELVKSNSWLSIELVLLQLYPDQASFIDEYKKVFEKLKIIEPVESDINLLLSEYECDPNFDPKTPTYVDVSGEAKIKDPTAFSNSYAIEFLSWSKWLGMDLAQETIKNFSGLEIIAHCLNEMTYSGFEEEEIQDQFNTITSIADEYKNLSEEEKKLKTISHEELKKQIEEDQGLNKLNFDE